MALEPSLQLALSIMPTIVILGWMTGQFTLFLEFDTCELTDSERSPGFVFPMLRAIVHSASGRIDFILAHVCSVYA